MKRVATGFVVLLLAGCDCSAPPVLRDSSIDFGEAQAGTSVSKQLLIDNPSDTALKLSSLDAAKSPFTVKFVPLTVPAKGSAAFDATFMPAEAGSFQQELVLTTSGGNYNVIATCPLPNHAALSSALGGGSTACITDSSWSTLFDGLIQRASGSASSFTLSAAPSSGISVEVDGLVVLPTSGGTTVWTVDDATRQLTFAPNFKPPVGSLVRVTYATACH